VATDIRGSRDKVLDGQTGLLLPVRDPKKLAAALSGSATSYDEAKAVARLLALIAALDAN
jgi:hypothetical protein